MEMMKKGNIETKIYTIRDIQVMLDSDLAKLYEVETRKLPYVFSEQGVYMLATVINSKVAINVTKTIMRTFTKLREFALNYKDVIDRVEELEKTIKITGQQTNYNTEKIDEAFTLLNEIIKDTKETNKNLIGFERE